MSSVNQNPTSSTPPSMPNSLPGSLRPDQGPFVREQWDFLKEYLSSYLTKCNELSSIATGSRGVKGVKGDKKDWILQNVYPIFVKQFNSSGEGGPNLDSLKMAIVKWFQNHSKSAKLVQVVPDVPPASSKPPRATNPMTLFAKDHASDIKAMITEERTRNGTTPQEGNLPGYRKFTTKLFNALDDQEKAKYEAESKDYNAKHKQLPDINHIYKNQESIIVQTMKSLRSLCGKDWGQMGDVAFFVQGAFRDANEKIQTFNVSMSENPQTTSFSASIRDFDTVMRKPFKKWAQSVLPDITLDTEPSGLSLSTPPTLKIMRASDGSPIFPKLDDVEMLPLKVAKLLLNEYLNVAWNNALPNVEGGLNILLPWGLLVEPQRRTNLMPNADRLTAFKSLCPTDLTSNEIYSLVTLILNTPKDDKPLISFRIDADLIQTLMVGDDEIHELPDPLEHANMEELKKLKGKDKRRKKLKASINFSPPILVNRMASASSQGPSSKTNSTSPGNPSNLAQSDPTIESNPMINPADPMIVDPATHPVDPTISNTMNPVEPTVSNPTNHPVRVELSQSNPENDPADPTASNSINHPVLPKTLNPVNNPADLTSSNPMNSPANPTNPNLVIMLFDPDHPMVSSTEGELEDGMGSKDNPSVERGAEPVSKAPRRTTRKHKATSSVPMEVATKMPAAIGPDRCPLKRKPGWEYVPVQ